MGRVGCNGGWDSDLVGGSGDDPSSSGKSWEILVVLMILVGSGDVILVILVILVGSRDSGSSGDSNKPDKNKKEEVRIV